MNEPYELSKRSTSKSDFRFFYTLKVFNGKKEKTVGGLTKNDLRRNADKKLVSKKRSDKAKKNYKKGLVKWFKAVSSARKALGIKGMVLVGTHTTHKEAVLLNTRVFVLYCIVVLSRSLVTVPGSFFLVQNTRSYAFIFCICL